MKLLRHLAIALALLSPLPASLDAQAANYLPGVGAVNVSPGGGAVTLAIPGKAGAPYRVLWLSSPYRLVVDLQGHWLGAPKSSIYIGSGLVTQIRAARHTSGITRIVFDLTAPADVRADNQGGTLVLTVVPRGAVGAAPVAPVAPGPYYAPTAPVPTRRPVPAYPAYPPYGYPQPGYPPPVARVTPIPVLPPMGWVTPPPGQPMPMFTPPPQPMATPMPMMTPPPAPIGQNPVPPPFTPDPNASPPVFDPIDLPQVAMGPKPVFGNRFIVGGGAAISFAETYTAGNSDLGGISFIPNGEVGLDYNFTPNLGMSLGARFQGYNFEDQVAKDAGVAVKRSRDEIDTTIGIRGRFDLMPGLEVMAQPQFALRTANVKSTITPAGGTATDLATKDYLSVGYLGYGGGLGAGLGYRPLDWMALAVPLEFNYLLGSMGDSTVTSIFPLMNIRAGAEARFDFGGFATTLGYRYTMYSNGGVGFSQSFHGPVLNLGAAF